MPSFTTLRLVGNLTLIPFGIYGMAADHNASGLARLTETMLIGPSWTLCYDLLFYLLAPWLFAGRRGTWWVFGAGFAYFAASIAFGDGRPPVWTQFFYETGMPYLFMFACGALAYHYHERLRFTARAATALIGALLWLTYFPLGLPNTYVNHLLVVLLFTPLVATLGQRRSASRTDRVLGDLTYATYLLHLPLLILAQRAGWPGAPWWALALTYALSGALLWSFELPLDRLRDRLYVRAQQRQLTQPSGSNRAVPAILILGVMAAGVVSLWGNLWHAGETRALEVDACPARWTCAGGQVSFDGPGEAALTSALPPANRIVIDIDLRPGTGAAWAGLESPDGKVRVGIRREGETCALEFVGIDARQIDPPGWNGRCQLRRLALAFPEGRLGVVVDSLWVLQSVAAPPALRPVVRAEEGSRGEVSFGDLFVTRR